jgi:hypothetical protein
MKVITEDKSMSCGCSFGASSIKSWECVLMETGATHIKQWDKSLDWNSTNTCECSCGSILNSFVTHGLHNTPAITN